MAVAAGVAADHCAGDPVSRPFLIVALAGDDLLAIAAVSSAAADEWTITLADGDQLHIAGEANVHALLGRLNTNGHVRPNPDGYERDDPETGAPLPPGVYGYQMGRRTV